ncbi:MAG: MOSC domain-containing protein [Ardenticatenales bacterium]|nr:MOSC domain-containing protein [Ardenticatenales bacterium]
MPPTLESIWIKRAAGGTMDPATTADAIAGVGLAGNADQGGRRQVTIISRAAWDATTADLGAPVDPSARRANLLVRGIDLAHSNGRVLAIGNVRVRIHGETRPCALMDQMHNGLRQALDPDWRAGAYGEVLDSGTLSVGDPVGWVEVSVSER